MARSDTKKKQEELFKKRRKTVKDGKIVENKQFTVNKDGRKVLKPRSITEDLGKVLPFLPVGRVAGVASKIPGVKSSISRLIGSAKNLIRGSNKTGTGSGQGSGKFNPPAVRPSRSNSQVAKPRNTQLKNPSRALSVPKARPTNLRGVQQQANRAAVVSGLSQLSKPKKAVADTKKDTKKKDFGMGKVDSLSKGKARQGPSKGVAKKAPEKRKSKSNISNSSSYDADFTRKNLEKRGLKAKNFMSPKNFASTTKERDRKVGKSMNFSKGGVVKMRGGGAAVKGMKFNRGY
tara:strand:+ start:249 stop:1118 length:870 start_codon:yes stop_codon:yes gene_type:complete